MLELVKLSLRITTTAFDAEIENYIEACKMDLKLAGIKNIDEADHLTIVAVSLFVKSLFGANQDSEKYKKSYESIKCQLAVSGDYNE